MIAILLTIALLAQAEPFVELRICYLDFRAHPPEFRTHPSYPPVRVRPSAVTGFLDARVGIGDTAGIQCSLIHTGYGSFFVVGAPEQIEEKLRGGAR